MTVYTWPQEVNTKFFSMNERPLENTEEITFVSGRRISFQTNTKKLMQYSLKLELTKTELATFWTWFNDYLGQTANAFTCAALGSGVYRFSGIPEPEDTDQKWRVLSMEIEEVL